MLHATRLLAAAVGLGFVCGSAVAVETVYASRAAFLAAAGPVVVDDYEHPAYFRLPAENPPALSDAEMNAVRGLATYRPTGYADGSSRNYVLQIDDFAPRPNHAYCAGCNGSFELGFAAPSIGTGSARAVGLDYVNVPTFVEPADVPYFAFVTLADRSTRSVALSRSGTFVDPLPFFFGLTSTVGIRSIAFGLADGRPTQEGGFAIDNLAVGVVPEPAASALWLAGLGALALVAHRRRRA